MIDAFTIIILNYLDTTVNLKVAIINNPDSSIQVMTGLVLEVSHFHCCVLFVSAKMVTVNIGAAAETKFEAYFPLFEVQIREHSN